LALPLDIAGTTKGQAQGEDQCRTRRAWARTVPRSQLKFYHEETARTHYEVRRLCRLSASVAGPGKSRCGPAKLKRCRTLSNKGTKRALPTVTLEAGASPTRYCEIVVGAHFEAGSLPPEPHGVVGRRSRIWSYQTLAMMT
jgi:hypothetical protein